MSHSQSQGVRLTWFAALLAIVLAFSCITPMFAQAPEGRIAGVVRDPSGAVIANASITATNEGTNAKFTATAGPDGGFVIPSLATGSYTVKITAQGFSPAVYTQVKVQPGREYSLTATMQIGAANESVEVQAGQELVNTTSSELVKTVGTEMVQNLPLDGHDIMNLVSTQAGVNYNVRQPTTINGSRPSWSQVTLEGINIQDPFIRDNALDYIPNRPSTDTVAEFTINSSTQGADQSAGSASGVKMVMPSGTNQFHGRIFEYNRNSAFSANEWFNNYSGVDKPFLNRNDFGANLGGPILKDKLFFYGFYEGRRLRQMRQRNTVVPLDDNYLKGQFSYIRPSDKTLQTVNVIDMLGGVSLDPKIQQILASVPSSSMVNNNLVGDGKNTGGLLQNMSSNNDRDNMGAKIDFDPNSKHHFDGMYSRIHEFTERPTYDPVNILPAITNDSTPQIFTGAWRWTASNKLINNVRFGANLVNAPFLSSYKDDLGFLLAASATNSWTATSSGIGIAPTQVIFQPQGRNSHVWQILDDATYVNGNHSITFGGQMQASRVNSYNYAGLIPTVTTGFSTSAPGAIQLTSALFPVQTGCTTNCSRISSTDLAAANALRAYLGGVISSVSQTFEVKDKTSGFVQGQENRRLLAYDDWSLYLQDKWRVKSNLVINAGLKWEYFTPLKEENGLLLGPKYSPNYQSEPFVKGVLMNPNGTVIDFLPDGRSYNPDRNNFGPTVGFAWDPFKDGKTSIRGGYTMTFVNDNMITFANNAAGVGNQGLESTVTLSRLYTTISAGVPTVPTPTFKVPRTNVDQMALGSTSVIWALDPNVRTPRVHEITFGIERELPKDMSISVHYVGTLGRDMLRGVDLNQTNAGTNAAYLAAFSAARQNGYLAQAAGGAFDPRYNATIPGSQNVDFLVNLLGPYLNYSTTNTYLQQNQAGELANWMVVNRAVFTDSPDTFLPNPSIYAVDYGSNGSFSSYHSMQTELRRRFKNGISANANYTWSKLLTDSQGVQTRFDPLLDNARPYLAKARSDYDLRHAIKGSIVYELPFGKGRKFMSGANAFVDGVFGGWQVSSILNWQSGNPFSILSNRGTFNRAGRTSGHQGAFSTLTQNQIRDMLGLRFVDGTPYYIDPKVINPDTGRAVSPDNIDNSASFDGQVFFNPVAGQTGNLGIFAFDSPAYSNIDLGIGKTFKITERVKTQFRADMFNMLNHPIFWYGDDEVNATNFGQIIDTANSARQVQFSLRVSF